jgi:N-acyl-D-aspartate/D-glutamate deacylase
MVNRNDATVPLVMVGGVTVWRDGSPAPALGVQRTGRFLRAGTPARKPLSDLQASRSARG